ncbi:MAG: tetratricopeptide repeat protein [Verrucomicrobiota bacterium]
MRIFPEDLGKWRFLPLAFIVLLLLAGSYGTWFIWTKYQGGEIQAAHLRKDAAAVVDLTDALMRVSSPSDDILRMRVKALGSVDQDAAWTLVSQLKAAPDSEENRIDNVLLYCELAIASGRLDEAEKGLAEIHSEAGSNQRYQLLTAKYHLASGDIASALMQLDRLLSIDELHTEALLLKGLVFSSLGDPTNLQRAKVNFRESGKKNGEFAWQSLQNLAKNPNIVLFDSDRRWLVSRLQEHPRGGAEGQLLAANFELRLYPEKRDEILARVVAKTKKQNAQLLAEWLLASEAYDQLKGLIQEPDTLSDEQKSRFALAMARIDRDWPKVIQMISQNAENLQLAESRLQALNAEALLLNLETTHSPDAKAALDPAIDTSIKTDDLESLGILAAAAAESGHWSAAETAYRAAVELPQSMQSKAHFQERLVTVLLQTNKTAEARDLIAEYITIFPQHDIMLNNLQYLNVLLGDAPDLATLQRITAKESGSFAWPTYSFALMQNGQLDLAEKALSRIPNDFREQPSTILLSGLLAVEQNNLEDARQQFQRIEPESLLPEEQNLLLKAQTKIGQQ